MPLNDIRSIWASEASSKTDMDLAAKENCNLPSEATPQFVIMMQIL